MDSHDFGLSESNFSMSKRSANKQASRIRSNTAFGDQHKKKEKKEFYAFQGAKFTSYTGDAGNAEEEEDDEF